jgi:hypothetical protein
MSKIQKNITNLNDLDSKDSDNKNEYEDNLNPNDPNYPEIIRSNSIDLFIPLSSRIKYLIKYHEYCQENLNYNFGEVISRITGMYFFSKTKNLEEFINHICQTKDIEITYRIECCKNIGEKGFEYINDMLSNEKSSINNLATPFRIDTVFYLMKSDKFKKEARDYFCNIINDPKIEELYRYRTIQKLESEFEINKSSIPLRIQRKKEIKILDTNVEKFLYYARESCVQFINNNVNTFTYRVLACQYLFGKCSINEELSNFVEDFLLSVANDPTLNDDLRADSADVIMQYGSDQSRELARNVIYVLGGGQRAQNNIFKNSQNVHVRSIEESVQKIINQLTTYHPKNKKFYDFIQTRDDIFKLIENEEKNLKDQIEGSLIRISLDRAVYGNNNITLSSILSTVWTYIQDSEFRIELEKRLLEELVESSNKCSSGYASRLVNSLSGFTDMNITISFEDQICSNLEARLTSKIRLIDNEEYMEKILNEMTVPVLLYNLRSNFLRFFRENISKIREEMYQEFRHYMEDVDYDFYFRKAIIRWEGCN